MKKYFKFYIMTWAIMLVVFNVVVWVTPSNIAGYNKFDGGFWPGYIFITLAFAGQFVCANFAFKEDKIEKLFLNMPLITVSYVGLVMTIILGILCMLVPVVPGWAGVVVCVLVVGFTALAVFQAKAATEIIGEMDGKSPAKTIYIRALKKDAEALMAYARDEAAVVATKEVYEAVRYSDPMSNEALSETESQITLKFASFEDAVKAGSEDEIKSFAKELIILINDRNMKCKFLK